MIARYLKTMPPQQPPILLREAGEGGERSEPGGRRGTEIRHISLAERDGKLQIVLPVYRTSQIAVMSVRSEADLQALKARPEQK